MGWSIGYDDNWERDIGYGVPAYCDHDGCGKEIDRGLSYVCCSSEPYGGEHGCGRYYCEGHQSKTWDETEEFQTCDHEAGFKSQEHPDWIAWKLKDKSWQKWRDENPEAVSVLERQNHEK